MTQSALKNERSLDSRLDVGSYVLLIAGSPKDRDLCSLQLLASEAAYVLAADSGANLAHKANIILDYLVGDFDSIAAETFAHYLSQKTEMLSADPHKDETDLQIALNFIDRHPQMRALPLVITNVLGGRTDHELAALGAIGRYPQLNPRIYEDDVRVFFLDAALPERAELTLTSPEDDTPKLPISVIPLYGKTIVSITGMEWNLNRACLLALDSLGVSNYLTAPEARVIVHEGSVAVFVTHANGNSNS